MTTHTPEVTCLEAYRPMVRAVVLDRLGDPDAADDLVQDVFEQALRHHHELRDEAALPGWLRAIAVNACLQHRRRRWEEPCGLEVEPGSTVDGPDRAALRRALLREVLAALREVPENNRLALLLHVLNDLSYDAIARLLDVPASTVEGRIYRARRQLRAVHEAWLREAIGD